MADAENINKVENELLTELKDAPDNRSVVLVEQKLQVLNKVKLRNHSA